MRQLRIKREEANRIQVSHKSFIGADSTSEKVLEAIREIAANTYPARLKNAVTAVRTGDSRGDAALLVRALVVQPNLPPTPLGPVGANHKLTLLSEVVLLGVGLSLGEPLAYQAEKSGALVQHVFPVESQKNAPSNESSAAILDLHTEIVFSPQHPDRDPSADSPDFLLLLCVRSDPQAEATTLVAEIQDLCAQLSDSQLSVLMQPRFELRAPYSFTRNWGRDRPWVGPVAILTKNDAKYSAAFDLACGSRGIDPEAELALSGLRTAAATTGIVKPVRLRQGDLLVLDNRCCAHGRTSFPASFDGTDRWIERLYVRRSLGDMRPLDPSRSLRIF